MFDKHDTVHCFHALVYLSKDSLQHGPPEAFSAYLRYIERGLKSGDKIASFMNRLDDRLKKGLGMFTQKADAIAAVGFTALRCPLPQ